MRAANQQKTTSNNWQRYTKAGAVFIAATATYLLARTSGAFNWLWQSQIEEGAVNLPLQENAENNALEIEMQEIQTRPTSRYLLQTGSGVVVVNPISDQVIEATEVYQYDIKNVFVGNYTLSTISLANGSVLPSWLSVKYPFISSYDMPSSAWSMEAQNDLLYVADLISGLQILNVSNPLNITRLGSYDTPGNAYSVQIQNGLAYVADDTSGLQVLNISNPLNITHLGSYDTPGRAFDVQIQNKLAYVADGNSGLQVLNISNPFNITRLSGYNTTALTVQVQNGLAYVSQYLLGLQILNVSNPANITRLGNYDTPGFAGGVQVQNGLAYVADDSAGLQVLNVSNPLNITRLGGYATPGAAYDIQVQNDVIYVAIGTYSALQPLSGLQVLNISNPLNITCLGSYNTPNSIRSVQVSNGLAYIVDYYYPSLTVIDVRQGQLSGTPSIARVGESDMIRVSAYSESGLVAYDDFQLTIARLPHRVDTSLIDRSVLPTQTLSVDLDSDVLFTDPSGGTLTLSTQISALTLTMQLSNTFLQLNPVFLASYSTVNAVGIQVQNGLAYVADASAGLQILDVTNLASITRLGGYDTPGIACAVQIQNGIAYVADYSSGLQVLNVSNPLNITRLGGYDTPGNAYGVKVQNGLAYVADDGAGLQILNVSNLSNITRLGSYDTPGFAYGVEVQNGLAYVADCNSGLQVLNISNPLNVTRLGGYDTPDNAFGVQVQNGLAYVADYSSGLQVLNVSNPRNITRLGGYDTPGDTYSVQVINGLAYVMDGTSGLQLLNVSNPLNITRLGNYDTPSYANAVQVQNGVAYVADSSAGLQILDLTQWQWRVTPTFAEVGNYRVTVIATNELGGAASDSFELRIEGGPQLSANIIIPQLFVKVGVPFNYFIPQGLLSDPNNDPISFSARSADNSSLPSWLSFNGISATFSGLAQSNNVGNYSLRIIATDNIPGTLNAETVLSLSVDHLPTVNQRVSDQVAGVGLLYNFTVPSNTFIDPDNGDILSYSSRQRDGSALPAWLNFNNNSRLFSGMPNSSDSGSYSLVLLANDGHQGEAQSEFNLLVEQFPIVNTNQTWTIPVAGVGKTWAMTLPPTSFIDLDDAQLSYALTRADGGSLPSWLSFNPFSGALLGVPLATDLGVNPLRVIATDPHGGSAYRDFNLTVEYFPSVANTIPKPPAARVLRPFNFSIPPQTFSDLDSPTLIYDATLSTSQPLPAWLNFNTQSLVLSGTPNLTDEGTLNVLIRAQDPEGASIGAPVDVVIQPNSPPQLLTQISSQVATVLDSFDFYVPMNTFQDVNGDVLHYSAQLSGGGGLPGWLKFEADSLRFHGTPGRSDTGDFGSKALDINLIAADDLSQTPAAFRITVQGNSHLLLFFKIGGPLFTSLGLALGLYKKRSLLLNRYQKQKYQKPERTAVIGERFFCPLATPSEKIAKVQVKLLTEAHDQKGLGRVVGLFSSSHERLPGHLELPSWMDYDTEQNALFSLDTVPVSVTHKQLIIQVKDKDNITQEEFVLKIQLASQLNSEDELLEQKSAVNIEVNEGNDRNQSEDSSRAVLRPMDTITSSRSALSTLSVANTRTKGLAEGVELSVIQSSHEASL